MFWYLFFGLSLIILKRKKQGTPDMYSKTIYDVDEIRWQVRMANNLYFNGCAIDSQALLAKLDQGGDFKAIITRSEEGQYTVNVNREMAVSPTQALATAAFYQILTAYNDAEHAAYWKARILTEAAVISGQAYEAKRQAQREVLGCGIDKNTLPLNINGRWADGDNSLR